MMREIKFRAWDGKKMFPVDVLAVSPCTWDCPDHDKRGISLAYQPSIKVMQFTGIQDQNGKDIYEGDIVEFKDYSGGAYIFGKKPKDRNVVKWDYQKGGWKAKGGMWFEGKDYEVLGNIYENPDLLKFPGTERKG